ncbi:hypothetical protein N9K11_01590, partial [bacterium]|nr:hypothetical protein [bacterium]
QGEVVVEEVDVEDHGEVDVEDHGEVDVEDQGEVDMEDQGEVDVEVDVEKEEVLWMPVALHDHNLRDPV